MQMVLWFAGWGAKKTSCPSERRMALLYEKADLLKAQGLVASYLENDNF
jgi:hypothetical protein